MSEWTTDTYRAEVSSSKRAKSGKRHFTSRKTETPRTIILGTICVLILLTIAGLKHMFFQCHQCAQPPKCPLENQKQENNSTLTNTVFTEKPLKTGGRCSICKRQWMCCGEKCYYFSQELMNFEDSRKFCDGMDSRLIKIEDQQQLNFIQSQISYFYWIGLSREGTTGFWTWEDNSQPLLEFFSDWKVSWSGNCGSITASTMSAADCAKLLFPICEKRFTCLLPKTGNTNKTTQ